MKKFTLLILVSTIMINCNNSEDNLRNYYYPFSDKVAINIYKYVDKDDKNYVEYWEVTTYPKTNEIKTVSYDAEFIVYNTFHEKITDKGAELIAYSNFDFDINENRDYFETKATIIDKDVYKWSINNEYKYSVKYESKFGQFEFHKKRKHIGFENIKVNEKQYLAAKFKDDYVIDAINQETEYRFNQESYYVKNIGMIKYKRIVPVEHKTIELELKKILTKKEFERLKASR